LGVVAGDGFSFVDGDRDRGPDVDFFNWGGCEGAGDELDDFAFEAGLVEWAVEFLRGQR
jgi:hypothetical protein